MGGIALRTGGSRAAWLAFVVYAAVLVVLALAVAPISYNLAWDMTAAQVARSAGYQDPGSFVTGALDILRHGWVSEANYWVLRLWPPGFMFLQASLLRLLGEQGPILPALLATSVLCCASWMLLLRQYLLPLVPRPVADLAPLLPFAFPVTPFFLLGPLGLAFGETFAISFFLAAYLLLLHASRSGSPWQALTAGLALALSAYFRSQFETLALFLTAGAIAMALLAAVWWIVTRRSPVPGATLMAALVAVVVAQLAMAPWRVHNYLESGRVSWVYTSDLIARNSLTPEQTLLELGARFVVRGGGHLACKLERSSCGSDDSRLFYVAFFKNMVPWLVEKAKLLPEYWLAPPVPKSLSAVLAEPTVPQAAANALLAGIILVGCWLVWRRRGAPDFAVQAWFHLSLYVALAGVYSLAHLEARYFYLPKIFGVVALITLLPLFRAESGNSDTSHGKA